MILQTSKEKSGSKC